jgi:hypothetical protein
MQTFLDRIGGLLDQYASGQGAATREEAQEHYDQIAQHVPPDVLRGTIGPAIGGLDGVQVEDRIRRSASQMTPEQRGGMLSQLLGGLAGAGGLRDILGRIGVDPSVASNPQAASAQDVAKVAAYAKDERPDLFHKAMEFYAEHPLLVKTMGTLAVAAIAKRLAGGRRPGLL